MSPLPPPVEGTLSRSMRAYWLDRAAQHTEDSYAGVPLSKFPEDLRVYEHLIWLACPDVVIELGTHYGGSALWLRDRLRALESYGRVRAPRVISVDLDLQAAAAGLAAVDPDYAETITLMEGDVLDRGLPKKVARMIPRGARCLVIEDSAHVYETTRAALDGFARFIPPAGYFVVEDGCVDIEEMRLEENWPRGVLPAIEDWLATKAGSGFRVRRDLELYGMSCHPGGFLQRVG